MVNRQYLLKSIFICFIPLLTAVDAASITWVAPVSDSNMNNPANWNPNTVPGSSDEAIFNSAIAGINTNPISNSVPFSVSTFNFLDNASVFSFNFHNSDLTFNGAGITGNNTNCAIHVANMDNSFFPGHLISFVGGTGTSGNSYITSSNSATLIGNQSNVALGSVDSNFYSSGSFTIADGGEIIASNTGSDSASGTGNNGIANISSSQLRFDQSFTGLNNVTVSVSNSGIFSGSNTVQGDAVSLISGSQFISSGQFQVGDNFSCEVQNIGIDTSSGIGLSNVGQINAAQMILQSTADVGDNCSITISNAGLNVSQTTDFYNSVGFLNDQQFFVENTLQAGNDFNLTVSNIGVDVSSGRGNAQVATINSNSGSTGSQILLKEGGTFGDRAAINVSNDGAYAGSNANGGPNVAIMNLDQITIGDSNSPGSFAFNAGDDFNLNASCFGSDNGQGLGLEAVGVVSFDQIALYAPCSLGNNANITVTKGGAFIGQASQSYVNVGSAGCCQLSCKSTFQAGDNFTLSVNNAGFHAGVGIGGDFIGDLTNGEQVGFHQGLTIGNNASINISNSGLNSSNTTNNNQVGTLLGYGKQLLVEEAFQTGDNLSLTISNSGFDDSIGAGGNYVGFINNNTFDHSASQLHLDAGGIVGDKATIALTNTGTYQGSNTSGANTIAVLAGQQFYSVSDFHAGDNFNLMASNLGASKTSGQSNHTVGQIGDGGQFECGGDCILGNSASIVLTNGGINEDSVGTSNRIGCIIGSQMKVSHAFSAGTNLNMDARNTAVNAGDSSNLVGHVSGSQFFFEQSCILNDNSRISAFNSGTLEGSQMIFGQGFDIASGKAFIQAVNEGTVGSFGIDIQGSNAGGNAEIILGRSSLYIETTLPTFTIGGLNGDDTSVVQSRPALIINTDASTQTEFSGVIQDFPATVSTLIKAGPGTQKLSGTNTYTGLTEVQEGTLIISGSIAGDALTNPNGTLKGHGIINGRFINKGTVAPGESIGTLSMASYVNNGGTYEVEINGAGQSDLLHVLDTATLNGGTVVVSSVDGTFRVQQPYTIVTAEGGVLGRYTGASFAAFATPTLTYDPNNVYLTLRSALLNAAESCNQFGVAKNLDGIINPSDAQSLLISSIAILPLEEVQKALESLSGFQYTNDVWMTEISIRRFLRRLYDPLRTLVTDCDCCSLCDDPCSKWTTWIETGGGFANLHGKNAHDLHANTYQVTGGIQRTFSHVFTLGLAGSYEHHHVKYKNGKENGNTEFLAIYGLYRPRVFYGLFDLAYGNTHNKLSRTIDVDNLNYTAKGRPNLHSCAFYGEMGFDLMNDCVLIQPFLGIQLGKNSRKHFKEDEANGIDLVFNKHDWTSTSSRLGLHLSKCHLSDFVDISLDVAWNQLWSSKNNSMTGRFREFGDTFRICGNHLDNYSFDYALTLATCPTECFKGYLEIGGEWWRHANACNVLGGIEFTW